MLSADQSAAVAVVSRCTPAGRAVKRPFRISSSTPIRAGYQATLHTLQARCTAMFVYELEVPSLVGTERVALDTG
ncbi:hypothetical protein AO361_17790 [Pseudomonas fluorescens]|nr:hypothetical protein AO361_17790 [Pseudomonas fluorescens]